MLRRRADENTRYIWSLTGSGTGGDLTDQEREDMKEDARRALEVIFPKVS